MPNELRDELRELYSADAHEIVLNIEDSINTLEKAVLDQHYTGAGSLAVMGCEIDILPTSTKLLDKEFQAATALTTRDIQELALHTFRKLKTWHSVEPLDSDFVPYWGAHVSAWQFLTRHHVEVQITEERERPGSSNNSSGLRMFAAPLLPKIVDLQPLPEQTDSKILKAANGLGALRQQGIWRIFRR